jgi:anthranilate/para-aminobenzoate synthase component I
MKAGQTVLYTSENGWFDKKGFYIFEKPIFKAVYDNDILKIDEDEIKTKRPLLILEKLIKKHNLYALGFIGYDFNKHILNSKSLKKDDLALPKIFVNLYKKFEFKEYLDLPPEKSIIKQIKFNTSKSEFIQKVEKIKDYISKGDIYQANLSHRIDVYGIFYPFSVFMNLVKTQAAPYMMFIKDLNFSLISGSMELFLEKKGREIITKPIKGTIKRGSNELEDEVLKNQLINSEKERAENLMITDLMRNDLSKIASNVKVEELFKVDKYSTLFQMSSTVKGILKEKLSFEEVILNTFPPGSVTGAPKKRAMEIIDELEDKKRSVYCGATFLIKPNLDFVMSVAIRQMIFTKDSCSIYVGSGIVWDSDPVKEYKETLIKAKANLKSLDFDIDLVSN